MPPLELDQFEILMILRFRQLRNQGQDWVLFDLKCPAILDYGKWKRESLTQAKILTKLEVVTTGGSE